MSFHQRSPLPGLARRAVRGVLPFALRRRVAFACLMVLLVGGRAAQAGAVFNLSPGTLEGAARWDTTPRTVFYGGTPLERSLSGGLRYSLQGGSYEAYRNQFHWQKMPSVAAFQTAVEQAFAAWTVPDPVTGLMTQLSFVADLATPVVGKNTGSGGSDPRGAEIDLFGSNDAYYWDPGDSGLRAEADFSSISAKVTLTSGTKNYASNLIYGADIIMNSDSQALWTLNWFRRVLMHEIGHTLGLGDVEGVYSPGRFIDDNYDPSTSATAAATLTNSWALLVDPYNPANSPLGRYTVDYGDPGSTTPGVDILMESFLTGFSQDNPLETLTPLRNDDYGTRQFLYPSTLFVPEPSTAALLGFASAICGAGAIGRRKRSGVVTSCRQRLAATQTKRADAC
jgi:hypothetical protein